MDTELLESNNKTLGEKRVNVIYKNDSETLSRIEDIRNLSAELIDLLEEDFRKHDTFDPEIKRVYANAQTEIESACMWSIKAICK